MNYYFLEQWYSKFNRNKNHLVSLSKNINATLCLPNQDFLEECIFLLSNFLNEINLSVMRDFLLSNLLFNRQLLVAIFTVIPQSPSLMCFPTLHSESMDIDTDI